MALGGTLGVAIEVFAEEGGAVASVLEPGGHGRVLVAEPVEGREAAILANIVEDPVRVGVLPAQDRGARGAAKRRRDEGVGKRQPLLSEKGLHVGHAGNRPGIEIVGDDDDYVWRPRGCGVGRVIVLTGGSDCGVPANGVPVDAPVSEQDCGALEGSPGPGEAAGVAAGSPKNCRRRLAGARTCLETGHLRPRQRFDGSQRHSRDPEHLDLRRLRPDLSL